MKIELQKVRIPDKKTENKTTVAGIEVQTEVLLGLVERFTSVMREKEAKVIQLPVTDENNRQIAYFREQAWSFNRLAQALKAKLTVSSSI